MGKSANGFTVGDTLTVKFCDVTGALHTPTYYFEEGRYCPDVPHGKSSEHPIGVESVWAERLAGKRVGDTAQLPLAEDNVLFVEVLAIRH